MMKQVLFSLMAAIVFPFWISAQDCAFYYPEMKGAKLTYQNYDKKMKPAGKVSHEVLSYTHSGGKAEATVKTQSYDEKDKLTGESTIEVRCEAGIYYIDMRNFITPETMAAYKDMDVKVNTQDLEMPGKMKAGDKLKDGSISMEISSGGLKIMSLSVLVTDRIVAGKEDITTPAGTFNCHRINQKVTSKVGFTVVTNSSEWYSEGVGLVKNESYSTDGKLNSSMQLIELKK